MFYEQISDGVNKSQSVLDASNLCTGGQSVLVAENAKSTTAHNMSVNDQFDTILVLNGIKFEHCVEIKCLCMFLQLHAKLKEDGKIVFMSGNWREVKLAAETADPFFTYSKADGVHIFRPKKFDKVVGIYTPWISTPFLLGKSLISYFIKKGYLPRCYTGLITSTKNIDFIKGCSHMFAWNSYAWSSKKIQELCHKEGFDCSFMDYGWSGRGSHYWDKEGCFYIDRKGVKSESSLAIDRLSWVTQDHIIAYRDFKNKLKSKVPWLKTNKYVLCPLEGNEYSLPDEFRNNQDFIEHVQKKYPDKRIIFTLHPRANEEPCDFQTKEHNLVTKNEKPFDEWAQDAELVYGIDSKALLESIAMGVPTEAVGEFFSNHEDRERLMAAYFSRLVGFSDDDLDEKMADIGLHFE